MEIISNSLVSWYTKEHLVTSILYFFKKEGYRVYKEESVPENNETIIFAVTNGSKEIIQVKGYVENIHFQAKQCSSGQHDKLNNLKKLEDSLIILSKAYNNKTLPVALCLPFLSCYQKMIENLHKYFSDKNLDLRIYLVQMDGNIVSINLNNQSSSRD
ncbi:MAG TPA: hypothetical protein VGO09_01235 [Flavisolibacter sp.]|jgi:hypothetical protein|nr:hypothetical protein [Flavisolibacter sp.]